MEELNNAFNNYINEFKKIQTIEKRKIIIESIIEIINIFKEIAKKDNIELHYLEGYDKDILKKDNFNEDTYLEKQLIYIETAKNIIGEYLSKKNI